MESGVWYSSPGGETQTMMAEGLGHRIRQARERRDMTAKRLAQLLDLSLNAVYAYERDEREPSMDTLRRIADVTNTPLSTFYGDNDVGPTRQMGMMPVGRMIFVPIVGAIRGGPGMVAQEEYEGMIGIPEEIVASGEEHFVLRVSGDSMNADRIQDGDMVLIRRQDNASPQEIAVVLVDEQDATLKRISYKDNIAILSPSNPAYSPTTHDARDVRVLGVVIMSLIYHRH